MAAESSFKAPINQPELSNEGGSGDMDTIDNPTPGQLDYRREYDRLDAMGIYTAGQIETELTRKGLHPNPPTAEEIEEAEVKEISERLRQAPAEQTRPRRKPPTRYGPRDKGPPQHIVDQIRGED